MMKIARDNKKVEVFYFSSSDLTIDDVVFDTENELNFTPAQKRSTVMELMNSGLLSDGDGKMSMRTKAKVLEILGYGSLSNSQDLSDLHIARADEENLRFSKETCEVEEFDDHEIHIAEHTRFLLSEESAGAKNNTAKDNAIKHVRMHKASLYGDKRAENVEAEEQNLN